MTVKTNMNERTASDIAALTPGQCWDIYVGNGDPHEYSVNDVCRYVNESPLCRGLDDAARDALESALLEMVRA